MKKYYDKKDGYRYTIEIGIKGVSTLTEGMSRGRGSKKEQLEMLKEEIQNAVAIVIGAGAGLSTSAGFTYSGDRFERYFFDFEEKFGIKDMYSGGFYQYPDDETKWAWWARNIYFNRYVDPTGSVYNDLLAIVKDKNYFVITTNVDHQFQKAGFDKSRLFYTQGDFGLFQSVDPANQKTYDNEEWVMKALKAQGFIKDDTGIFKVLDNRQISMKIPSNLIPKCPDDGADVTTNLRIDGTFVEDEGWHNASEAYYDFLEVNKTAHVLFMELGVGSNTPVIVKYPFWQMTRSNDKAVYACINYNEAYCPMEIEDRSICIDGDIGEVLSKIK